MRRTGATTPGNPVGSTANLDGTYTFTDGAPVGPRWAEMAAATADTSTVPTGSYRASDPGPDGGSNATILPGFSGVTDPNGTWTLKVKDGTSGDGTAAAEQRGQVNFVSLEIVGKRVANADSLGDIPDAPVGSPAGTFSINPALQRNVQFPITGLATAPPSAITLSMTFAPAHTYIGDLDVRLIAPDGTEGLIFSRVGASDMNPNGDSSNLDGAYQVLDIGGAFNWWTEAAGIGDGSPLDATGYHASTAGGGDTSLVGLFSGVTNPNGTWILRVRDGNDGDTGGVSFASLDVRSGTDTTDPDPPSFTGTVPNSPSSSVQPKVKGTAESGSGVRIFADDPFCSSADHIVGAGTTSTFASTGITVSLPTNTQTQLYAYAYDTSGRSSPCTHLVDYTHDSISPATPTLTATVPSTPANDNFPKLKGSGAEAAPQ